MSACSYIIIPKNIICFRLVGYHGQGPDMPKKDAYNFHKPLDKPSS